MLGAIIAHDFGKARPLLDQLKSAIQASRDIVAHQLQRLPVERDGSRGCVTFAVAAQFWRIATWPQVNDVTASKMDAQAISMIGGNRFPRDASEHPSQPANPIFLTPLLQMHQQGATLCDWVILQPLAERIAGWQLREKRG